MNQSTQEVSVEDGTPEQLEKIPPPRLVEPASQPDLLDSWMTWLEKSRGLLPTTRKLYLATIMCAQRDLGDLLIQDSVSLERWVQEKGGKPSTYSNRICALTSFYRYCVKFRLVLANPCDELDRPRQRRGVPKPVENLAAVYECMDRLDAVANASGPLERKVGETRAMAEFLSNTGLRIHEAVALDIPTPAPRSITIVGKGAKEAIVPLNTAAREALDFLGGTWPIGARATQRRFEKVAIVLGLDSCSPHKFRHSYATNLVKAGVEIGTVSKLCRHSSPSTTMIYAQYQQKALEDAVDLL